MSYFAGKTVLVTGASGFVGGALVRELLRSHAQVRVRGTVHRRPLEVRDERLEAFPADLTRPEECLAACRGADIVLHAAGSVGSAAVAALALMQSIAGNLVLTARVMQAAWEAEAHKCLVFSSTTGYPLASHPLEEDEMYTGPFPEPYAAYASMRCYFESLAAHLDTSPSTRAIVVRPSAVYGPRDSSSHVIPALIEKAAQGMDPFEVWGTGQEVRDFLYIDDLARGCLAAVEHLDGPRPVNLASGEGATIAQVVEHVLSASGHRPSRVAFRSDRPVTIPFRLVSTARAERELGFRAQVSLADGVGRTVAWYAGRDRN